MSVVSSLKRFFRALRGGGGVRPRHAGDAVARTASDALGARGWLGSAQDRRIDRHIGEGAENYDRSFDD